jgi:hypothetical protein
MQQRLETSGRIHEADQVWPQVAWCQRARVAHQGEVAPGLGQDHARLRPAIDPADPLASLEHVQPDQRAGPIWQEPVPQQYPLV